MADRSRNEKETLVFKNFNIKYLILFELKK